MFPIWRSTAPLLRSSLPGVRNTLSRSSLVVASSSSSSSPLLRGLSSSSSSPLLGSSLTFQQQQLQQQLQKPEKPLISSSFSSRFYASETKVENGAEELMKKGKELFDAEDYKGSYTVLLEAYTEFEKQGKIEHLLVVSTLIFNVCKKGGLEAEQQAFMERAQRSKEPITKEQEEEREKMKNKAKNVMEQTSEIYQLQNKGKQFMGVGNFEEAKKVYFDALKLADKIEPPNHGLIALLNAQCGAIQGHIGEYEQSEGHLRASIRHYKQVVGSNFYLKEYLETLRLLGDLFMKRRRFASAVKEYEAYAEEAKKFRSFRESWDGMLLMADCTIKMDEFDKGFELYDDAIHFAKSLQMNSCHIETHIRIGQVKEFLNKPEEGLRHYQSGLALARKFHLVEHQAKCLLHVGNIHRSLKNTQMADAHLRLAKDLITTSKMHHLAHLVDFYLGKLLLEIGNLTDAGLCLKKAIETSEKRDLNVYKSALCDYGIVLIKEDKPAEAIPLLEEALDCNAKFQDHSGMMRCYSHMIQAYRDMGKETEEREATIRLSELNSILQKKGIAVPLDNNQ